MSKKGLVIFSWILIILVGPITLLVNNTLSDVFSDPVLLVNFFQRITGLLAFSFLFVQILLGAYMTYWQGIIGAKTFKYHVFEGVFSYLLILAHPLLYIVFTYQTLGTITTFILPNLDVNSVSYELYLTYGRIAFVLLSIGVAAGLLRNKPFLRHNWRKFHILNYFSFFFIAFHAWHVGSDVSSPPFSIFFWFALAVIAGVVFKRFLLPKLKMLLPQKPAESPQELSS